MFLYVFSFLLSNEKISNKGFGIKSNCLIHGCVDCKRWEARIKGCKNFSKNLITARSTSVKKDSIEKHLNSEQHRLAADLSKRSLLGAVADKEAVSNETPIDQGLRKMSKCDEDQLTTKFNCVYYLLKRERPFVDYPELLKFHEKNRGPEIGSSHKTDRATADVSRGIGDIYQEGLIKNLTKARYYSILNDGSSDTSVSEKELVYVLFLENGTPNIKFVSIEDVKNDNAKGILDCIQQAFHRLGITDIYKKLVGLNVDGASVNTGKFTGLGNGVFRGTAKFSEEIINK